MSSLAPHLIFFAKLAMPVCLLRLHEATVGCSFETSAPHIFGLPVLPSLTLPLHPLVPLEVHVLHGPPGCPVPTQTCFVARGMVRCEMIFQSTTSTSSVGRSSYPSQHRQHSVSECAAFFNRLKCKVGHICTTSRQRPGRFESTSICPPLFRLLRDLQCTHLSHLPPLCP